MALASSIDGDGLVLLDRRGEDIVVGISGFGSARVQPEAWSSLAPLTGRTAYVFRYDAQELPWDRTPTLAEFLADREELARRWMIARMVAAEVADNLGSWLVRWLRSGRRVLLIGFSLGGYLAWKAVGVALESLTEEEASRLEVILISAALGDHPDEWARAGCVGRICNVYSKQDRVLRFLYPMGVSAKESTAVGLGAICVEDRCASVENLDVTDLVGTDHLWAGDNLDRLVRIALATRAADRNVIPRFGEVEGTFDGGVVRRLGRWTFADPDLWHLFGEALRGSPRAQARCVALDAWATPSRQATLGLVGSAALRVFSAPFSARPTAERGFRTLYGSLRRWLHETAPSLEPVSEADGRPAPSSPPIEAAVEGAWSLAQRVPVLGPLLP
jgi:hypothetical protein